MLICKRAQENQEQKEEEDRKFFTHQPNQDSNDESNENLQ
jgi:hypothetical protein